MALVVIFSSFLVWSPFIFWTKGQGMLTVFANYDGPNYLIVAKTLYNPTQIKSNYSLPLPVEYYAAHLPGYPLLIKVLNPILPGPWAMLTMTLLTSILAVWAFYFLVKKFKFARSPFWLSFVFLFLPARFLVVRSVGSAEPLFIFAVLASLYFFKSAFAKKEINLLSPFKSITLDFFLAGLFGSLAQVTKSPGILLFVGYTGFLIYRFFKTRKIVWQAWPLLLIPLSVLPVFLFYKLQTGDFWAYFHSGDNLHLTFSLFPAFNSQRPWLSDFWLEEMIYIYLLGALSVIFLFRKKLYTLFSFASIFFFATLFIAHRDLSRYSLPLAPLALIAFSRFLERKEFKIAFLLILPAIFLYAINFITYNFAPIQNWGPYL